MRPSSRRSDTILRSIASRLNGTLTPWSRAHWVGLFRYPASENVKSRALLVGFGNLRTSHGAESYISLHPTESRRMCRHAACFGRSARSTTAHPHRPAIGPADHVRRAGAARIPEVKTRK